MRRSLECSKKRLWFWMSFEEAFLICSSFNFCSSLPAPITKWNKTLNSLNSQRPWIYYYKSFCDLEQINRSEPWFAHLRNGDHKGTHHLGLLQRWNEIIGVENLAQCLAHSKHAINLVLGLISYPCYGVSSIVEKHQHYFLCSCLLHTCFLCVCYSIILHFNLKGMRRS